MRITVFGAAGSVGGKVVLEALARNHQVTAVVRDSARFSELPNNVEKQKGDASKVADVIKLSQGQDLVIAATRPQAGQEQELVSITHSLLAGLGETKTRLIAVGGAGSLMVPDKSNTLVVDDSRYVSLAWRDIAMACVEQYEVYCGNSEVDWSYLSPAAMLGPGERTAVYQLGKDELVVDSQGQSSISIEDLAVALIDEAEQNHFSQQRFTLAY